jgi:hypothetical protein
VICTNTWPNQALYASPAYKEERNMPVFFFLKPIRLMIANHNCSYLRGHFMLQSLVMSKFEA